MNDKILCWGIKEVWVGEGIGPTKVCPLRWECSRFIGLFQNNKDVIKVFWDLPFDYKKKRCEYYEVSNSTDNK